MVQTRLGARRQHFAATRFLRRTNNWLLFTCLPPTVILRAANSAVPILELVTWGLRMHPVVPKRLKTEHHVSALKRRGGGTHSVILCLVFQQCWQAVAMRLDSASIVFEHTPCGDATVFDQPGCADGHLVFRLFRLALVVANSHGNGPVTRLTCTHTWTR